MRCSECWFEGAPDCAVLRDALLARDFQEPGSRYVGSIWGVAWGGSGMACSVHAGVPQVVRMWFSLRSTRLKGGYSLTDRGGLAEDFILEEVALGLELAAHFGAKGPHLRFKCSKFGTEGVELGAHRSLREFHLSLNAVDLVGKRLQIRSNHVLQELTHLGDEVFSHTRDITLARYKLKRALALPCLIPQKTLDSSSLASLSL